LPRAFPRKISMRHLDRARQSASLFPNWLKRPDTRGRE
jgi:hypothetical protein